MSCCCFQVLAEGFAERAANLVDLNDRAYTMRAGGLRNDDDDAGPRGGYQDGQYPNQRGCVNTHPHRELHVDLDVLWICWNET